MSKHSMCNVALLVHQEQAKCCVDDNMYAEEDDCFVDGKKAGL